MHCAGSERSALFGHILGQLYQTDVVDEDDISGWHALPEAKGEGLKPGEYRENVEKAWLTGARLLHQLSEQDSTEEEDSDEDSEEEDE